MAAQVQGMPIVLWAVFFLIQTGRGASLEQIDPDECEDALHFLHDLSTRVPFGIKTTEAPHYHRVARQRQAAGHLVPVRTPTGRAPLRAPRSVNDGNGFLFIDHVGAICPSGFLPLVRGNVRRDSLVDVYRHDETFTRLRDADALEGRCGRCEFRRVCGGSRARAYAATGSPYGTDPLCTHVPAHPPVSPSI
jgi:AdoMet-dependent heme synthase